MSLIEEALRRVQDIRPPNPPPPRNIAPRPAPAALPPADSQAPQPHALPAAPSAAHRRPPEEVVPVHPALRGFAAKWIGLLCVLGVSVGVSLGTYRFITSLRPAKVALPTPPPAPLVVASAPEPVPTPPEPSLTLSGVVEGVGEPFAIINQQIVRLGEEIDGAVLVAVEDDRARVRWKKSNEEVTLRTIR